MARLGRTWILQGLYLLGSGAVAAAGFVLFAAGGFFNVPEAVVNEFLLTVAVHVFAVTAGVFGADRRVLSSAGDSSGVLTYSNGFIFWNMAVAMAVTAYFFLSFNFSALVAVVLGCAVCFDSYAVLVQTWLSKKSHGRKVMWANLLRYPLFFFTVYVGALLSLADLESICIVFAVTSAVRLFYLYHFSPRSIGGEAIAVDLNPYAGFYQIVNFLIFRGGQLLAGFSFISVSGGQLAAILSAWKLVEFVDKVFVYLMTVVLGFLNGFGERRRALFVLLFGVAGVGAFWVGSQLLGLREFDGVALLLISVHAMFLLPVNVLVLDEYRLQNYALIVRLGLLSLLCCFFGAVMAYLWVGEAVALLAWSPIALVAMSVLVVRLRKSRVIA